jgi:hypothetical protein
MMNIMSDGTDEPSGIAGVSRRALRIASAAVEIDERTGMRALLGYPTRSGAREKLLRALKSIGTDVSGVPAEFQTGAADLTDAHRGGR